jgi:predicted acylesterase/phospholipase RssA
MQKSFASVAMLAVFAQQVAAADKCYALALSSGDQNSMYQAGVIKGLATNLSAEEMAYSAISGVAGGAVNTPILANYPAGQEADAADRMKTFWENSANTKLYKDWLGGLAEGLLLKGGLWNDAPALDFLKSELADITPTNRWIDVGLTDVLKGTYVDY